MKKLSNIDESMWGGVMDRSAGRTTRLENDINNLSFDEFVEYLKNTYTSIVDPKFFQIGAWYISGSEIGVISIPIEKNNRKDTPNCDNRMLTIKKDTQRDKFESISPSKSVFRLYSNELVKTFGDKYSWKEVKGTFHKYEIYPITGEITNQICVDVIDRLLSMVENPILKKNS